MRQMLWDLHSASTPRWGTDLVHMLLIVAASGCQGPPTGTTPSGELRVSVSTTGEDIDLDGYSLRIDGALTQPVGALEARTFPGLAPGSHLVELSGVAENCTARPGTTQLVTVTSGQIAAVAFVVECAGTGIEVLVPATGLDFGAGYTALVDGSPRAVFPNVRTRITRLSVGTHEVVLTDVSPNCTVTGPLSRTVDVVFAQVASLSFPIACVATTGNIEVTTQTSGSDLDLSGYTVRVGALSPQFQPTIGKTLVTALPAGDHLVHLDGVGPNCTLQGDNPRGVAVTAGTATRDTARVTFQLTCAVFWKLAFERQESIALASISGAGVELVGLGSQPAWSPDGGKLAYDCGGICIRRLDGLDIVQIPAPSDGYDVGPAWRPDGARIALSGYDCGVYFYYDYCSWSGLFLVEPNGANRSKVPLPASIQEVHDVAWSPEGDRLAFTCVHTNWITDICLVKPDGSGFERLTSDTAIEGSPTWRPDASSIAFHTNRHPVTEIVVMNLDDRSVTRFSPELFGMNPAWSPDGATIAFEGFFGLFVINADGSGRTRLTTGFDSHPAWRP
jgi:TolB protein